MLKLNVQHETTSPRGGQGLTRAGGWVTAQLTQGGDYPASGISMEIRSFRGREGPWTSEEMEATAGEGTVLTTDHSTCAVM